MSNNPFSWAAFSGPNTFNGQLSAYGDSKSEDSQWGEPPSNFYIDPIAPLRYRTALRIRSPTQERRGKYSPAK